MALTSRTFQKGKLPITAYDFGEIGDELPTHSHEEGACHITIVARGSLKAFGPWGEEVIKEGAYREWEPHQEHGMVSLEPDSRIFNIVY